ncbi:MAG: hypothetical protein K0S45_4275 [Nitrospira sp.]|nr:hypothetical protein [Nitrospira sp.]
MLAPGKVSYRMAARDESYCHDTSLQMSLLTPLGAHGRLLTGEAVDVVRLPVALTQQMDSSIAR